MLDKIGLIGILIVTAIYALKRFFKKVIYNGILGIFIRLSDEINEGDYIEVGDVSGKVVGQDFKNTKITDVEGNVQFVLHEKIYNKNVKKIKHS